MANPTQLCFVCGESGTLVYTPILVAACGAPPGRLVAECRRCGRFVCSEHAEKLAATSIGVATAGPRTTLVCCCPFDPGVPLGTTVKAPRQPAPAAAPERPVAASATPPEKLGTILRFVQGFRRKKGDPARTW